MLKLLRQKYLVFVEQGVMPCLDSLMSSCSQLKANWSKPQVLNPVFGAGPGGGPLNVSSVLRQQMRNYSKKAETTATDDNCGAPKECDTVKVEGPSKGCGPPHFKGAICDMVKGSKLKKKEEEKEESKPKKPKKDKKFKSMWDIPGCEYEPKCDVPTRLDIAHYRISDKIARAYQVTWNECPRLVVKPKKVCIHRKRPQTQRCRRKRKTSAVTVTAKPTAQMLNPMKCKDDVPLPSTSCPRFSLPCCKPARNPPCCKKIIVVGKCKKRPAPYPSFSECKREELTVAPPVECFCLATPMACEVWAEVRRRIARGKSAVPKCGDL